MTDGDPQPALRSPFWPTLLLALTVLAWTAFQTWHLFAERTSLQMAIANQQPQMEQSEKVRAALENIATRTARIAQAGNANATIVVEELRKRGITINPDAQPQGTPPAP